MTDKYTLEEIEKVFQRIRESGHSTGDGKSIICSFDLLREELTRPKHNFREGEVVYDEWMSGYIKFFNQARICRPLRLSEMPQAVEDLRNYVLHVARSVDNRHIFRISAEEARKALEKFDAEVEK